MYGYGKVRMVLLVIEKTGGRADPELMNTPASRRYDSPTVQPDADFECIAVMLEHTQDVKCLAWHPTEEVSFSF